MNFLYTCSKHWCLEFNICQNSLCLITKVTANNLRLLETGNECTDRISWEILEHVDLKLWPLQEFGESKNVIITLWSLSDTSHTNISRRRNEPTLLSFLTNFRKHLGDPFGLLSFQFLKRTASWFIKLPFSNQKAENKKSRRYIDL